MNVLKVCIATHCLVNLPHVRDTNNSQRHSPIATLLCFWLVLCLAMNVQYLILQR